jgi:hypothetical protein
MGEAEETAEHRGTKYNIRQQAVRIPTSEINGRFAL